VVADKKRAERIPVASPEHLAPISQALGANRKHNAAGGQYEKVRHFALDRGFTHRAPCPAAVVREAGHERAPRSKRRAQLTIVPMEVDPRSIRHRYNIRLIRVRNT